MTLPDGPTTPPALQLIQWIADPFGYMETNARKYGDLFTARLGSKKTVVMVSHPEAMQQMLLGDAFEAPGDANDILRPLLGDNSLILLDGDRHKKRRKLLMPPFHGERMRSYGEIIRDIAWQTASQLAPGSRFIARDAMKEITMRIILRVVFGLDEGLRFRQLEQLIGERLGMTASLPRVSLIFFPFLRRDFGPINFWKPVMQKQAQVDELIYAQIAERRANPDPNSTDILSLLLLTRDEAGRGLSDVELRDELITLLVAGHETTATALAWALYWIHKLPQVREKLLAELDSLGDNPDPMTIFRLPYLTAVCQETLRIYPVGMLTFTRVTRSPVELMGCHLEPGVEFLGSIYLTHQREDLYPEPKQFKPERFLERQYGAYEFMPFGGGARRCIGIALAQFEMKLVLATILSRTELALADSKPIKPKRRGLVSAPSGGVPMVLKSRRQKTAPSQMATV
ncbi:MAG: cytochrome P450 [Oscillatoria sp. SIO1A7]|nr:cytochrome P450 [Oscillatoria sp. SIO1A7]